VELDEVEQQTNCGLEIVEHILFILGIFIRRRWSNTLLELIENVTLMWHGDVHEDWWRRRLCMQSRIF